MDYLHILRTITSHPLNKSKKIRSVFKFLKWHLSSRINPFPIVYPYTEKSKLVISRGMRGATGNIYCGLHEFYEMSFLLHFLRPTDLFGDIGANVGTYTVLASAHIGAFSISAEPVRKTFESLLENLKINGINTLVQPLNMAIGSKKGSIYFTNSLDTTNHVANSAEKDSTEVQINSLDNLFEDNPPILLKIDVEGFETEVIKGSASLLGQATLKAIIIELNGLGERYGYDDRKIHDQLLAVGFKPCLYTPENRRLSPCNSFGKENTIYVRDVDFVKARLESAPKFKIYDRWI